MAQKLQIGVIVVWHGLKQQYILCLEGGEHGRVSDVVFLSGCVCTDLFTHLLTATKWNCVKMKPMSL